MFGCGFDDVFADDATAWFGVMTAWLGEGLGRGEFTAMHQYDERVRWGTEARPDRELWGGDDRQLRALADWEATLEPAPVVQQAFDVPLDGDDIS